MITPVGFAADEVLRLAASLDQASPHVLAASIVSAARDRDLALQAPEQVTERHGYGVEGRVDGRWVRLGKAAWTMGQPLPGWVRQARRRAELDGSPTVFASVDGAPAGVLLFEDPVRPEPRAWFARCARPGIARVVLVTGDRADIAETVGRIVGVDAVYADRDPADKLAIVSGEQAAAPTIMAGDGINDAPALAAAGVGVALAARGATASAEAADVVLTVDRVDALADAILIARRARRIAWRAVLVGMGLSIVAMLAAAAGWLPPAAGALLQELIDVASIAIALTALLPARTHTVAMAPADIVIARRLYAQHRAVRPVVEQVRAVADDLRTVHSDLRPVAAAPRTAGHPAATPRAGRGGGSSADHGQSAGWGRPDRGASRTHAEIEHQVARLRRILTDVNTDAEPEDIVELRRLLYGLYAILRLHNAQEEEGAFSLLPDEPAASAELAIARTPSGRPG